MDLNLNRNRVFQFPLFSPTDFCHSITRAEPIDPEESPLREEGHRHGHHQQVYSHSVQLVVDVLVRTHIPGPYDTVEGIHIEDGRVDVQRAGLAPYEEEEPMVYHSHGTKSMGRVSPSTTLAKVVQKIKNHALRIVPL